MSAERTIVTFQSMAFNTRESKDYFINSDNYGDDLAVWLSNQLESHAIISNKADPFPGQEDFGWFFNCRFADEAYCIVIGHHYDKDIFEWVVWIERECGLIGSFMGLRKKNINPKIPIALHEVLSGSDSVSNIRWHNQVDFDKGRLTEASALPS